MQVDLAIIGAGPAGLAAAIEAQTLGLKTVLLDEQTMVGGQIYRNIERPSLQNQAILGTDYYQGSELATRFKAANCRHISGAMVWQIEPDGSIFYSCNGVSKTLRARHILIANGAQERPVPIPGWTLPGVMTAGSAQVLLKTSGMAAENAVFAGSGPLLYLITWQYLQAGIKVKALLDTTPRINYIKALKKIGHALQGTRYVLKGLKMIHAIKAAGIPIVKNVEDIEAVGCKTNGLEEIRYRSNGNQSTIKADHLFLHQGVIPNINLAMASQCKHEWNSQQLCWQPKVDRWGQSSQATISIAGDNSNIGGATAAQLRGSITAQNIAYLLRKQSEAQRDQNTLQYRHKLKRELAFRPFIDTLYQPAEQFRTPQRDDVTVCRCEEVRLGDIRKAAEQGCMGPNQLKSFTRCGMGACQGRQCGITVSEVMSKLTHQTIDTTGYYRVRAPIKPLSLGELATLAPDESRQANKH
ncbi:NAD(P)/FAD-dependent oxidoreductase [Vibrio alginolyticus]